MAKKGFAGFGNKYSPLTVLWDKIDNSEPYKCEQCGKSYESGSRYVASGISSCGQSVGVKCQECFTGKRKHEGRKTEL